MSAEDMKKIIHTAQGRSSRMSRDSIKLNIIGLYTGEFSTCCILAIIDSNHHRISLIHADQQIITSDIENEMNYVGNNSSVVLLFRENFKTPLSAHLISEMQQLCEKRSVQFKVQRMAEDKDGTLLSLDGSIRTFPLGETPPELEIIRHPDEQQFSAVQKIEQLIGLRETAATNQRKVKRFNIFDGLTWESLYEDDKKISGKHDATREEMQFFDKEDSFIVLAGKVEGIAKSFEAPIYGDQKTFFFSVAFCLEGYLNHFDANLLFIRDMRDLVDPRNKQNILSVESPKNNADKKAFADLKKELLSKIPDINKIHTIFSEYSIKAPDTSFKRQLMDEYNTFTRHFKDRNVYTAAEGIRATYLGRAKELYQKAQIEYKEQKYEAAANLFRDALSFFSYSTLKNDPNLANTYFSLAISLRKLNKLEEAKINFETSRNLFLYNVPKTNANRSKRLELIEKNILDIANDKAISEKKTIHAM